MKISLTVSGAESCISSSLKDPSHTKSRKKLSLSTTNSVAVDEPIVLIDFDQRSQSLTKMIQSLREIRSLDRLDLVKGLNVTINQLFQVPTDDKHSSVIPEYHVVCILQHHQLISRDLLLVDLLNTENRTLDLKVLCAEILDEANSRVEGFGRSIKRLQISFIKLIDVRREQAFHKSVLQRSSSTEILFHFHQLPAECPPEVQTGALRPFDSTFDPSLGLGGLERALVDLALLQLNLRLLRITGIPMSQNQAKQKSYDVIFVTSNQSDRRPTKTAVPHDLFEPFSRLREEHSVCLFGDLPFVPLGNQFFRLAFEDIVLWKTCEKKSHLSLLSSKTIDRITPLSVTYSPSLPLSPPLSLESLLGLKVVSVAVKSYAEPRTLFAR